MASAAKRRPAERLLAGRFDVRIGPVGVVLRESGAIVRLELLGHADFLQHWERVLASYRERPIERRGVTRDVRRAVTAFLRGDDRAFAMPLEPVGTAFQKKVWNAVRRIPRGKTITYGELAKRIRAPTAVRAAARANANNPIHLAIPTHRVIGANGSLGNWTAGHEQMKGYLLGLEGALPKDDPRVPRSPR